MSPAKKDLSGKIPKLSRGCRLGPDQVLLLPEGILRLSDTAFRIVELCDGKRSIAEIVDELTAEFAPTVHGRIRSDVTAYLEQLAKQRVLELK
jgi:pyrroloquinoline quinone biosynthesis protein D